MCVWLMADGDIWRRGRGFVGGGVRHVQRVQEVRCPEPLPPVVLLPLSRLMSGVFKVVLCELTPTPCATLPLPPPPSLRPPSFLPVPFLAVCCAYFSCFVGSTMGWEQYSLCHGSLLLPLIPPLLPPLSLPPTPTLPSL